MFDNADGRIRGRALQRIRAKHFRLHPLCVMCEKAGKATIATQLDHTRALVNGGTDTGDNRQGLCEPCHKIKTAIDMGFVEQTRFDASGKVIW